VSSSPYDVLIVGCGNIAGGFDEARSPSSQPLTHAGAYRTHGGFQLSACVDPNADRRREFMRHWGIPCGFANLEEALNSRKHFDIVSICSPTKQHYSDLLACANSGASLVFCEKPICSTVAEAEHALEVLRQRRILIAVNHNRRWDPFVSSLRNEIANGGWGRIRSIAAQYNKGILNNGSHLVDLLACLAGPLELLHAGPVCHDYFESDPSVPAMLLANRNIPVVLSCGHASDYGLFEIQIVLERGVIAMESGGMRWRFRSRVPSNEFSGYTTLAEGYSHPGRYTESMTGAIQNIYDAINTGSTLASTGETALAAHRLCAQILARLQPLNSYMRSSS
jgi:predicted dehydrogenase